MNTVAIGFTNKFYTLWNIYEDVVELGHGCRRVVVHYDYVKNISFDKATALAKYPDAKLDENLKGKTRSWISAPKEIWDNVDTFRFGKHKYESIENGTASLDYIAWYWDNIYDDLHKEYVENYLISKGYEVRSWSTGSKYLVSPEELENEKEELRKKNNLINKANNHEEISIVAEHNPSYDGELIIDNVTYQFEDVIEYNYQGIPYYLPLLNGKAKRIKNKKVIIKDYDMVDLNGENDIVIVIKDFIVTKI